MWYLCVAQPFTSAMLQKAQPFSRRSERCVCPTSFDFTPLDLIVPTMVILSTRLNTANYPTCQSQQQEFHCSNCSSNQRDTALEQLHLVMWVYSLNPGDPQQKGFGRIPEPSRGSNWFRSPYLSTRSPCVQTVGATQDCEAKQRERIVVEEEVVFTSPKAERGKWNATGGGFRMFQISCYLVTSRDALASY